MVIDEVYRILQYAFDNKLTIKEAVTKLNVNVKYSTVITYKNKYNITEYDRHKIDKKDVLKIIEYSSKHCIPEKEAITSLGYNISNLSYYKRKFGIETHPYGNAPVSVTTVLFSSCVKMMALYIPTTLRAFGHISAV